VYKIIKYNKVNSNNGDGVGRVAGGYKYPPTPTPKPGFPSIHTQLNQFFSVKFKEGVVGSEQGRVLLPCPNIIIAYQIIFLGDLPDIFKTWLYLGI